MTAKEFVQKYIDENEQDWCKTIARYFKEKGWDGDEVENLGSSRHWNNYLYSIEIGGRLIGYEWATLPDGETASVCGWDFDKDTICFLEPYTETITVTKYRKTNEI